MISELRAVLIGLKAIKKLDTSNSVTVKIITDYQGIIDFHRLMRKKSKNKIKKEQFHQKLQQRVWNWYYANLCNILASYRRYGKELSLEAEWIKGHSGHYWNEQVDAFSKKVVQKMITIFKSESIYTDPKHIIFNKLKIMCFIFDYFQFIENNRFMCYTYYRGI